MNYVLDASAMIAFLRGEQGAERVSEVLSNPGNVCCAHAINLCEVFYDTLQRISLADCFALYLSQRLGATLPTADPHEFDGVTGRREFHIEFTR